MGWTSENYTETTHMQFGAKQALERFERDFYAEGYLPVALHFAKAKDENEHHELWSVLQHPTSLGPNNNPLTFIYLTLIDVMNNQIFWKDVAASMGPVYRNCPKEFLSLTNCDICNYESEWRNRVMSNRITRKEILEIDGFTISI